VQIAWWPRQTPRIGIRLPSSFHDVDADAGIFRASGTGGEHDGFRGHGCGLLHRDRIVPYDADVGIEGADELVEVVGKTVVIVNKQESSGIPPRAFTTAAALLMHSRYSFAGTESATMPAPLRTKTLPFLR
jgi:hypothetical protein